MSERLSPHQLEQANVLKTALTIPGEVSQVYNRFHHYSPNNQALLYMQGLMEPVATYKKWGELDRQVKRGSKGKAIWVPMIGNVEKEDGTLERRVKGFRLVNCIFGLSETVGEALPDWEPPEWSAERALGALSITRVAFESLDGNAQGYSYQRNVAVSPIAEYPTKTLVHEVAHVVHGHTTTAELAEYRTHRGIKEFEAEGSAYLVMNTLGAAAIWNAAESRGYIQHWLSGDTPPEQSIRRVMSVADKIERAGRPAEGEASDV